MAVTNDFSSPRKLKIMMLGVPSVQISGETVTGFISSKAVALVYFLAATGATHGRETIAGLLWGEYPESKARKNLRDVLSNLRRVLGDYLEISPQTISLNHAVYYESDVIRFETALKEIEGGGATLSPAATMLLREAVDLYRGEFLDGFYVSQTPGFEEWLLAERVRLQQLAIQGLHALTEHLTHQGNTALGIKYARRLLALEPWREETHRHLMRLLLWSGQRSAALAQYETCRRLLAETLGVAPTPETRQLYERILRDDLIFTTAALASHKPVVFNKPLLHNLPAQVTRFVGREADLAELLERLRDPDCRLMTLAGPGGVGKTRLALEAARMLLPEVEAGAAFRDGIYLVRLAAVAPGEPERSQAVTVYFNPVAAAIADALQLTLTDPEAPTTRIQNYLREKEVLLVMDNFEHLAAAVEYLSLLLTTSPRLKLLLTSRSRLNVRAEQVYLVDGLPFPGETADALSWQGYSAVQLFFQTARATEANFTPTAAEEAAVVRICRLVNGLPLGIEMAASWVRILSCSEIQQELEQNLHFLRASMRDLPERHRTLWAVFTYSWNMLGADEQRALRQLSVFRNGFVREAAEQVAEAPLPTLLKLVDHSFVRRVPGDQAVARQLRFDILEILRLYAAEQLQQNPAEGTAVYNRHRDYFIAFLQQRQARLQIQEQQQALVEISEEIDNIRAAWRWSVLQQDVAALDKGSMSLFDYYDMRSRFQEGRDAFQQAAVAVAATRPEDREARLVWGRLLARQGWFTFHAGRYPEARQLLQQSVDIIRPLNAPEDLIFCLNYQGAIHFHLGDDEQAQRLCRQALTLSEAAAYRPGAGIALNILAQIAYRAADYDTAMRYGQQSLVIVTELGNPWSRAYSLSNLAQVAFARQDYDEMRRLSHIILEIREEMGDVRGLAMCLEQLGRTAVAQQNLADAAALYQRSLTLYHDIGNQRGMASTLAGLGHIALQQQAYEQARDRFSDALQRAIPLKDVPELPTLVSGLALALRALGEGATAVGLEKLLAAPDFYAHLPELVALIQRP